MALEFDGEKYKQVSALQKEWGQRLIAEFRFDGDERILDLGCGDGVLSAALAALVPRGSVLGLDASRGMIETAEKLELPNLAFMLADINELDYEDEFDLVFSNAALHWIKDHWRLLSGVYRCLKYDGIARFNFAGAGNCPTFLGIVRETMAKSEFADCFTDLEWPWYMPAAEEYEALVKQFPFRETRVWIENADKRFPDADALTGWLDQPSLVPLLQYVDGARKREFRDEVVERMLAATCQDDGTYLEIYRRVNLLARK